MTVTMSKTWLEGGRPQKYAVYLADTPGFDNSVLSDTEVLLRIAVWLASMLRAGMKLSGILYLHCISDDHIGGGAIQALSMLGKFMGLKNMPNVALVTTRWEEVSNIPT